MPSGRDSTPLSFARNAVCLCLAYILYLVLCDATTLPILDVLDVRFPFAFFYHLQEGEADGPLGDPMRLATAIWVQTLLFWFTFAPIALLFQVSRVALVCLTVFNPFLLLTLPIWIWRLFG